MPEYVKFLQNLLDTHQQLKKTSKIVINEQCSVVILEGIPRKMGNPGHLPLPCEFENSTKTFDLDDFGASISLMSYFFLSKA